MKTVQLFQTRAKVIENYLRLSNGFTTLYEELEPLKYIASLRSRNTSTEAILALSRELDREKLLLERNKSGYLFNFDSTLNDIVEMRQQTPNNMDAIQSDLANLEKLTALPAWISEHNEKYIQLQANVHAASKKWAYTAMTSSPDEQLAETIFQGLLSNSFVSASSDRADVQIPQTNSLAR